MTNVTHNSLLCIFIFNSLHVSSTSCSSSGEINCVNTISDKFHSVSVAVSCAGRKWTSDLFLVFSFFYLFFFPYFCCWGGLGYIFGCDLISSIRYNSRRDGTAINTCTDTATDTEWQLPLPEVVLTQFVSPDDEHDVFETCRELKLK
jgi:hypothetical protein